MRILQVSIYSDSKFGGPTQKIYDLSCGLARRGHQVRLLTFRPQQPDFDPYENSDLVHVRRLKWAGRALWQMPLEMRALRREVARADVVHCYGLYDLLCPAAAFFAWQFKRPLVLEPLGMFVPRARNHRAKAIYNKLLTSPMARRAARLIATSIVEIEDLKNLVAPQKLVLRRNGIDLEAYQKSGDGEAFRARFGIGAGERVILYVGRISPIKNLEALARAFHLTNLENARLVLVGPMLESDYAARLQSLLRELNLQDKVLLTGALYQADKLNALAAAGLFVMPSEYESFGNAAAEAVAAKVPVLLTTGCGIAPQIDGRAGLSVPPDAAALAQGLQTMLDLSEQKKFTARRDEVLCELSWDAPLDETEALYRAIISEARNV